LPPYDCGRPTANAKGRRTRVYGDPATPLQRRPAAGVLSPAQQAELLARRDSLNPAEVTRQIQTIQDRLNGLAKALPDTSKGIRTRKASRPAHGHSYARHRPDLATPTDNPARAARVRGSLSGERWYGFEALPRC
jgi:hypothetical protein